jgi:hypothetical protein
MSDLEKLKQLGEAFREIREAYEKSLLPIPASKKKRSPAQNPAGSRK